MNKSQKSHAGEYVKLLSRAHDEIRKAAEVKKYDIVRDLLEQCQEAALELGNMIEAVEGEGVPTIPLLESYCELTYQLHEEIWENHVISPGKVYKSLRKSLVLVENSVKHDIPLRTEAVFLPYKASMWDSLESVWKAADEDPDCDAYVIPIPYYDKNPDGSFREMHYEGNDYPDYVPVTWYEDYDFAERQPDMIFIHNPYDECNFVTSVHPFFYSKNLKQFTEKLVYIPYFILGEVDPNNKQAVDGVAHFCTCPGVINADKVIVQSEAMRQVYIHVMSDFAGEDTRKYWEKKILGSGSPKIDKVLKTREEDLEMPEEWMKIIQKPDGSRKKIVFYNTSVTALLKHDERMLRKMEAVFAIFKRYQDEVALLWRPHPLIKATIESMKPELWKTYEKIVEKYCREGWGIYDDTSDIDRAVILSDVYYGDPSSVVQLCKKAGKLCMIQDVEMLQPIPNKVPLWFTDAYIEGTEIWFSENDFNGLYLGDLETGRVKKIAEFPEEKKVIDLLYVGVQKVDSKLYFMPGSAEKIAVYDMVENSFEKIELPFPEEFQKTSNSKVSCSMIYKNKLFIFGEGLCVFEYDLLEKQIRYCEELSVSIRERCSDIEYFSAWYVLEKSVAYLTTWYSNIVIKLNLENLHVECFEIGAKENKYFGLAKKEDIIWIGGENCIVYWDLQKDYIEEIAIDTGEPCYFCSRIFKNKILFAINRDVFQIAESKEIIKILSLQEVKQPYTRGWRCVSFMRRDNNVFSNSYFLDTGNYMLHDMTREEYGRQFTISKLELMQMVCGEGTSIYQGQEVIEGSFSAIYGIETLLWAIKG